MKFQVIVVFRDIALCSLVEVDVSEVCVVSIIRAMIMYFLNVTIWKVFFLYQPFTFFPWLLVYVTSLYLNLSFNTPLSFGTLHYE
jgi:hypothetical protein